MNKMFKTPAPFKELTKKMKRQSLLLAKRRSTTVCGSVTLDEDFLAKLRSIPDAQESNDSTANKGLVCNKCNKNKPNENVMICHCQHIFHPSCVVDDEKFMNIANEIINNTKCPKCESHLETSEMMFIYAETCTTSNKEIIKNDNIIKELERQLEQVQKEFTLCKTGITRLSQQRDISKRIMATVVTMIS